MRKIDAMLIGASRSGSTWIFKMCGQHPDIYKRPGSQNSFFTKSLITRRIKIVPHLEQYRNETVVLGWRNILSRPEFITTIPRLYFRENPNMKFLYIIRNPIITIESLFMVATKDRDGDNFDINKELGGNSDNLYIRKVLHHRALSPYFSLFPKENFMIIPMESMMNDFGVWISRVFKFLGIDSTFYPKDSDRYVYPRDISEKVTFAPYSRETRSLIAGATIEDAKIMSKLCQVDLVKLWHLEAYL